MPASNILKVSAVAAILLVGCRPSEPPPTLYQDLGTEERHLLPTAGVYHDASLAKGTADWHPYRKLDLTAKPAEPAKGEKEGRGAAPADDKLTGEIRAAVDDFNAAVAEGKLEEVPDFIIEDQASSAKQVIEVFPQFAAKLSELANALPGDNENLKKVASALTLASILTLDVSDIRAAGEGKAVAKGPGGAEVRFVLVKEEDGEFWYIDHPQIRAMAPTLPALQQSLEQLDTMVAGIKSGQISQGVAAQQAAAMDQMLKALMPPGGIAPKPEAPPGAEPKSDEEPPADEE